MFSKNKHNIKICFLFTKLWLLTKTYLLRFEALPQLFLNSFGFSEVVRLAGAKGKQLRLNNKYRLRCNYIFIYQPSCLGQEIAKGPFGRRVKLPHRRLHTVLHNLNIKQGSCEYQIFSSLVLPDQGFLERNFWTRT